MITDTLVVLTGDKPSAKSVDIGQAGHARVKTATNSWLHSVETLPVQSLHDIYSILSALQHQPDRFIIRGRLIEGIPTEGIRRTSKPHGDTPPSFEACTRQWAMLDIDNIPLPEDLQSVNERADDIIAYAMSFLPEPFWSSACVYQWSGSMGFKGDLIRLHLWFWFDRPVSDQELKAWLSGYPVDPALFNPVQPHITANPILSEAVTDPIQERLGFYKPEDCADEVAVPTTLISKQSMRASTHRNFVSSRNIVDAKGIVRDEETKLVIDGREYFMFLKSNDATKELMTNRSSKGDTPTVDEIAHKTWELFQVEADISDGKWSLSDTYKEATRRHQELADGTYRFLSRSDNTILERSEVPYTSLDLVNTEEGQKRLEATLREFFNTIDEGPRLALRITMGAGKTHQTIKKLQEYLNGASNQNVEIYVPRHDLAKQYAQDIKALEGPFRAEVIHVLPRTTVDADAFPDMCKRPNYVNSLTAAGLGVFHNACRSNDPNEGRCEFYDSCPYIQQFRSPEVTVDNKGNTLRILVHSYLGLPRNPIQASPDLVIIDEAFLDILIDTGTELKPSDIRNYITTEKHPKLGRWIVDALTDGEPLLKSLKDNDVSRSDLLEVDLDDLLPVTSFTPQGNSPLRSSGNGKLHRSLSLLIKILLEEMALASEPDQVERLVYHPEADKVRTAHLKEIDLPDTTPILCLDATADPTLLHEVLGPIKLERIDIGQNAIVTQVYDRTGSKAFWSGKTAPVNDLIEVANTWAEFGERPLIVSHKELAERLQGHERRHKGVQVMHFGNLRGSNSAEDCSVIFLTGRNQPPLPEIDLKARALFWASEEPLQHDLSAQLTHSEQQNKSQPAQRLRGFIQSDKNTCPQSGVYVTSFSDDRIDSLLAQSRDAETMQALGRLRLVHSKTRKRVFLLSNLPVEMPVDTYTQFNDLFPDKLELELIHKNNLPLTPLGLLKMRPDLASSSPIAEKLLQRSKVRDPNRLKCIPDLMRHTACILEFEAENAGRWKPHRHLFLLPNQHQERLPELPEVNLTVGSFQMDHWVQFLEQGDHELTEASGWGAIRNPHLVWA